MHWNLWEIKIHAGQVRFGGIKSLLDQRRARRFQVASFQAHRTTEQPTGAPLVWGQGPALNVIRRPHGVVHR